MDDTSPEIKQRVRDLYMQMDGEQRFMIGVQMFETARKIALSSFPKDISDQQRRRLLCERFYKDWTLKAYPETEENHQA